MDDKLKLTASAHYMGDRLRGVAAWPPAHWSAAQIAAFAAFAAFAEILDDPEMVAALWAQLGEGQRQLDAAADALDDDDGPLDSSRN